MADKSASTVASMETMNSSSSSSHDESLNPIIRTVETLTRLIPVGLCIVALVLMLKNSQTNDFGSLSYSNLAAFRYLVHANGICAAYSLLSAIIAAVPRPPTMSRAWTFFFLDQIFTYIILAAGAVSVELLYLAYKGDNSITWAEECTEFGSFCHKATASVVVTFIVVAFYAVLSLISSYKLFSKFDAPVSYHDKGINIATFS